MRCIICTISVFAKLIKEGYCRECFKRKNVYEAFCIADKIMIKFERKIIKIMLLTYITNLVIIGTIGDPMPYLLKFYYSQCNEL